MESQRKLAFVTGGNRGIGLATAIGLGNAGVDVIIGARDQAKGEAAIKQMKQLKIDAQLVIFDINRDADHQKVFDFIQSTRGHLDILINNAGVFLDSETTHGTHHTSTLELDLIKKTFETNFFQVISLTQTLLPLLRKSAAGRIVNLSSILGSLTLHTDPTSSIYGSKAFAYNASKTALNAFTIHLAHELKDTTIKVNSAHPGWVKTEMGGPEAPLEVTEGATTSIKLALLPNTGPSGGFFHGDSVLPW